jgi:hypothetical protein
LEQGLRNQIVEVALELSGRPKRAFECNAHHRVCAALDLAVSHESRKAVRLLSLLPSIWVHVTHHTYPASMTCVQQISRL